MFDSDHDSGHDTSSVQIPPGEEAKALVKKWHEAKVRTVTSARVVYK